jgi:hypothetical protein
MFACCSTLDLHIDFGNKDDYEGKLIRMRFAILQTANNSLRAASRLAFPAELIGQRNLDRTSQVT